jgi:hypothetical protein
MDLLRNFMSHWRTLPVLHSFCLLSFFFIFHSSVFPILYGHHLSLPHSVLGAFSFLLGACEDSSVHPCVCNILRTAKRIFIIFGIGYFYETLSRYINLLKSDEKIRYVKHTFSTHVLAQSSVALFLMYLPVLYIFFSFYSLLVISAFILLISLLQGSVPSVKLSSYIRQQSEWCVTLQTEISW